MKKGIERLIQLLFKSIGLFHSPSVIYFESFHGNQYSDNPRAIYEYLKKHHPEYTYVWGVNKGNEKPFYDNNVNFVHRFSVKWFLTMPRAKAWVINTRTPLFLSKNKKTTYMETWHGTPLKKIGCDISEMSIPGYTKESYEKEFKQESRRWDYLISPNAYSTDIFRRAFSYDGPILEIGYPRNDLLVDVTKNEELKQSIKNKLAISKNQKVILYAPTWRETAKKKSGKYAFEIDFPFEKLVNELKSDVVILVRMHYLVAESMDFNAYKGQLRDVSTYEDMSELLAITDLLITDYSSCFFDFAITKKPMLFYIPDKKTYENDMRGFYCPMEEMVPGELITTSTDLVGAITKWQNDLTAIMAKNYDDFKKTYTNLDKGQTAKQASEIILKRKERNEWES